MTYGQSAIEYLMTYGWMLLVVAIAGGSVFSVIDGQSLNIDSKGFNEDLIVEKISTGSKTVFFQLRNSKSNSIELKEVKYRDKGSEKWHSLILEEDISSADSQVLRLTPITRGEQENTVEIEMIYDSGRLENLSTTGSITGDIKSMKYPILSDSVKYKESLVGFWTMRTAQNQVLDIGPHNFDGVLKGEPKIVDGMTEQAINFDGMNSGQWIELPENQKLNPQKFSISAWVKINNTSGYFYSYIYSNARDCCGEYNGIDFRIREEAPTIRIWNETATSLRSNQELNPFDWHHVAVTYDRQKLIIYQNGEKTAESSANNDIGQPSSFTPVIGALGSNPDKYIMNGTIDSVTLFDKALTGQQIEEI